MTDIIGPGHQLPQNFVERSPGIDRKRLLYRILLRSGRDPRGRTLEILTGGVREHLHAGYLAVPRVAGDVRRAQRHRLDQSGIGLRFSLPDVEDRSAQTSVAKRL